ncbi:MAG: hypothetical protein IK066_02305 [Kiritimatiellae bacterium]|nr:hypothetical protein [Kiritimatiellia bacterium]
MTAEKSKRTMPGKKRAFFQTLEPCFAVFSKPWKPVLQKFPTLGTQLRFFRRVPPATLHPFTLSTPQLFNLSTLQLFNR